MRDSLILEDLIHDNGISMEAAKVGLNPIVQGGDGIDDMEHYKCRLFRPGEQLEVYLSVVSEDDAPSLHDVLLMLAMDASGCQMLEGFDEMREEWPSMFGGSDGNLGEIENFWQEYQGRCQQSKHFKEFLGESAYRELLHHFENDNPLEGYADGLAGGLL